MPVRARLAPTAALAALAALALAPAASAAPGDLDPTFGDGGVVKLLPSNETSFLRGVAVQPDDKVVLAGAEQPGRIVLIRLLPNGAPDPGFGTGGTVVTDLPGTPAGGEAVALQPNGKIVVAGSAQASADWDFLLARYNADGSLDSSFGGGDGVTILPVGGEDDRAEAVAIGADGRIAAVGEARAGNASLGGVAVVRADGSVDSSFKGDGTTTFTTPQGNDRPGAVALLDDGRVLVGDASGAGGGNGLVLVRLLSAGDPDPAFGGGDGIALTPIPVEGAMTFGGRTTDFVLRGDGRIVASGYGQDYGGSPPHYQSKFAAVGYLADGSLDPTFASTGIFTHQAAPEEDIATTIDLAAGGKLLVAGYYDDPASGQTAPAVMRLLPDGSLDPAFGEGGVVLRGQTAPFGEAVDDAAVDSRDRLVTIGTAYGGNNTTTAVVTRYLGDVPPEPSANQAPHARMKKVPRKVAAPRLEGFSGTASDPDGAVSGVRVALVKPIGGAHASRREPPRCLVLRSRRGRFKPVRVSKGGRCPQRWLAAEGTARWSFRLKRSLPPGRYVVYARATDGQGLTESVFSRKAGNRYAFRVLDRRRRRGA